MERIGLIGAGLISLVTGIFWGFVAEIVALHYFALPILDRDWLGACDVGVITFTIASIVTFLFVFWVFCAARANGRS